QFIGKTLNGVIIKKADGAAKILTSNYIEVVVPDCPGERGEEAEIRIVQVEFRSVWGEAVKGRS
ncbi:MAG: tRNA (N(6)-L-threonylcarbamoyladenosine(37)-C(2))-methylthiotransferase MtaB, partial [Acidobacteriota bacterium]